MVENLLLIVKNFQNLSIFLIKKRPIDTDTVEKFITNISRSLVELGQSEINSSTIGTMVMDGLKDLDPVAYVRFASVYRNFREEKDFVQFVDKIDVFKKDNHKEKDNFYMNLALKLARDSRFDWHQSISRMCDCKR